MKIGVQYGSFRSTFVTKILKPFSFKTERNIYTQMVEASCGAAARSVIVKPTGCGSISNSSLWCRG